MFCKKPNASAVLSAGVRFLIQQIIIVPEMKRILGNKDGVGKAQLKSGLRLNLTDLLQRTNKR